MQKTPDYDIIVGITIMPRRVKYDRAVSLRLGKLEYTHEKVLAQKKVACVVLGTCTVIGYLMIIRKFSFPNLSYLYQETGKHHVGFVVTGFKISNL